MKRIHLAVVAGLAAGALTLTACGSAGSSGTETAAAGDSGTVAGQLVLGGPPEFQTRVQGVIGLKDKYDVVFKSFTSLDAGGPLTINALKSGQIQAADIFTTDPSIKENGFTVLEDPESLYPAQNVTPLVNSAKVTGGAVETLNKVSAQLTTDDLVDLNVKVISDKQDSAAVAKQWLSDKGLDATGTAAQGQSIIVGSANFPENVTVAEIYAQALQAQGATVTTKLNIGSRETYLPGLQDGSIDVIPEYTGALLQNYDKEAAQSSADDVYGALAGVLPSGLQVLDKSAAEDKDAIVVTKETASKYNLTSIADLAKAAS